MAPGEGNSHVNAKTIGRPVDHVRNSTPKKPKRPRRKARWSDNSYVLFALCVVAAVLIAAARLGFDRLQFSGTYHDSNLQFVADSSPGAAPNAASTAIAPEVGRASHSDLSEKIDSPQFSFTSWARFPGSRGRIPCDTYPS